MYVVKYKNGAVTLLDDAYVAKVGLSRFQGESIDGIYHMNEDLTSNVMAACRGGYGSDLLSLPFDLLGLAEVVGTRVPLGLNRPN